MLTKLSPALRPRLLRNLSQSLKEWSDFDAKSHFIEAPDGSHSLHLLEIKPLLSGAHDRKKSVCLLLHGAIENGDIFYSKGNSKTKARGLAPYLASQGHHIFVADLRGKGLSTPSIKQSRYATFGQTESIRDSIPLLARSVQTISGCQHHAWIGHSWGNVLMTSTLAWDPSLVSNVSCMIGMGSKRNIRSRDTWRFYTDIALVWDKFAPFLARIMGYFPSKALKIGAEDETLDNLLSCSHWIYNHWTDYKDGFNYAESYNRHIINQDPVPPTWHIAADNDYILGNKKDVKLWAEETGQTAKYTLLTKKDNLADYTHVSMLAGKTCNSDHFPDISDWVWDHVK